MCIFTMGVVETISFPQLVHVTFVVRCMGHGRLSICFYGSSSGAVMGISFWSTCSGEKGVRPAARNPVF